jgi:hypothetical protein
LVRHHVSRVTITALVECASAAEARAMVRTVPVAVTWNDPAALARLLAPIVNRYGNA